MIIKSINLKNFRNHKNSNIYFDDKKNLIYGTNGSGKTSILESIFLLGYGKSFLSVRKEEIKTFNSEGFIIRAKVNSLYGNNTIINSYFKNVNIFLNDKKVNLSQLNRYFFPVIFTSTNYSDYIERKGYKRKLFNRFIFGFEDLYLNYLLDYNKTIKKKNILLKKQINLAEFRSWNYILSDYCFRILNYRMKFINSLNIYLNKITTGLKIKYLPSLDISKGISQDNFFGQILAKLDQESTYKRSLIGIHLDDYKIELSGKDLKYSSSGEKKLNLLIVFIAMLYYYFDHKGEFPIFLIDDFNSAVDDEGLDYLFSIIPKLQIIATSINKNSYFDNYQELLKEN